MTHDKVRGCHMVPQECDTWHKKEWLTLSHMGGMIPWLILSHVGHEVIKRKRNKKKKKENGKPHIWVEEGGRKLPPFDPYGQCSKKEERNAKRREE